LLRLPPSLATRVRLRPIVTQSNLWRALLEFLPPTDLSAFPPKPYQMGPRDAWLKAPASGVIILDESFLASKFNDHDELSARS